MVSKNKGSTFASSLSKKECILERGFSFWILQFTSFSPCNSVRNESVSLPCSSQPRLCVYVIRICDPIPSRCSEMSGSPCSKVQEAPTCWCFGIWVSPKNTQHCCTRLRVSRRVDICVYCCCLLIIRRVYFRFVSCENNVFFSVLSTWLLNHSFLHAHFILKELFTSL